MLYCPEGGERLLNYTNIETKCNPCPFSSFYCMIFSHDDGDADQTSSFYHVFFSSCLQSQFCFPDCEYQRPWVPTNPSPFPQEEVPHPPWVIGALADVEGPIHEDPMHEDMDPIHERDGPTPLSWSGTSWRGRDRDRPGTGRGVLPGWGRFSSRWSLLQHWLWLQEIFTVVLYLFSKSLSFEYCIARARKHINKSIQIQIFWQLAV